MQGNKNNTAYKPNLFLNRSSLGRPLLFVIILVLFTGNPIGAQVQITATRDLAFGTFAPGLSGGTVIVSNQGDRSVTGTITALPLSEVSPAVIEVRVNGKEKGSIFFNLPQSAMLNHSGGGNPLTITNFTSDNPGFILDNQSGPPRTYTIQVGATLNVQNTMTNPPGVYTGTFTVTLDYQ